MIQEAYVSYEVAKLLKDKGFNELCRKEYYANGFLVDCGRNHDVYSNSQLADNECSAPTQQVAMRWLREVHNELVVVDTAGNIYIWMLTNTNDGSKKLDTKFSDCCLCYTYEDAVDNAIKCCLTNLIEVK